MTPGAAASRPAHRHRRRQGADAGRNQHRKRRTHTRRPPAAPDDGGEDQGLNSLSAAALAQLNRENARHKSKPKAEGRKRAPRPEADGEPERAPQKSRKHHDKGKKRRVVSGAVMEEGRVRKPGLRGGGWSSDSFEKADADLYHQPRRRKSRKKLWILLGCSAVVLVVVIAVAVAVSRKPKPGETAGSSLDGKDRGAIPAKWQNTYLDPWTWQTTADFNVTFTEEMVGDLPVMGLFSDPARFADAYRRFLRLFAEAQMHSFEKGWGWWYWTWKTESAPLWSYEAGLKAGILPPQAYRRDFNCDADVPDFAAEGLPETY